MATKTKNHYDTYNPAKMQKALEMIRKRESSWVDTATAVGTSVQTLSDLVNGKFPSIKTLEKVIRVSGKSANYFFST